MGTTQENAQLAEQLRNAVGDFLRLEELAAIPSANMSAQHHFTLTSEHDPATGAITVRANVVVRFRDDPPEPSGDLAAMLTDFQAAAHAEFAELRCGAPARAA